MNAWISALGIAALLLAGCAHGRTVENLLADEARAACVISNATETYLVFMCTDGIWTVDHDYRVRALK